MKWLGWRIPTILAILVLGGLVAGWWYYIGSRGGAKQASQAITPAQVRITNIADNKFSVSWTTPEATGGRVEYGVVGEKITSFAKDERDNSEGPGLYHTHHVTIEGLQPSTQYAFRILSGEQATIRFDNKGSPYTATTGPVIGETPASQNFYGVVQHPSGQGAAGAIVYLTLPGSATASTLVNDSGNYAITLSTIRSSDNRSYVEYDPAASIVSVTVVAEKAESVVSVSLANSTPVPTITLGQNANFLNPEQVPVIAQTEPVTELEASPESSPVATTPTVLNVEPLTQPDINQVSSGTVKLLNPKDPGETLMTLRPEFRGTGPAGITLSIALTGQKAISDTVKIASDGTWSWSSVIDLKPGPQKITLSYVATGGATQKLEREFVVSESTSGLDPAFVATPSATVVPSPTSTATPSPSPRAAMPATDSGVPVTGVIENTLLTAGMGIVIMIVGAILIAL